MSNYDDDDGPRGNCCPKCEEYCRVSSPAEPDVGIFGDMWDRVPAEGRACEARFDGAARGNQRLRVRLSR